MALLLRHRGITRIRPLQGGLEAWRDRGYPMTTVVETETHLKLEING